MDWLQGFHVWVAVAAMVSLIAAQKGRSGPLWLSYALLALPIALIHVLAIGGAPARR